MPSLVKLITPINLKEEKAKFFANDRYNPQFHYIWEDAPVNPQFRIKGKSKLFSVILGQGHDDIVKAAKEYFQVQLSAESLALAKMSTKKPPKLVSANISDIKGQFKSAFKFFGLDYKFVVTDNVGFNFRPSHKQKKIFMSRTADLSFFSVEGEVRHEMTHIIRYENSKFNKIRPSANYIAAEEGLASFMQDSTPGGETSLFQHAAEYLATEVGLKGSLRDIFNFLVSLGFGDELAWQRSIRHKFGFIDTSKPGDIMKPAMYFHYEQKIKKLSKDDQLKLFVGKISIKDLSTYKEYVGKFSQNKLIEFFELGL